MKAIVNTGPGRLELRELPMPEPGPDQVRIKTAACGVCVTDLAMIAGWQRTGFPAVPGHEWSGRVDAVGSGVSADLVGRRCVAENVLRDGGEVGFEHPGGYAEYFLTEAANVLPLPEDMAAAEAALIEPLAVCLRGMRRLRLEDKSSAVVFGDGPIGLLFVMLLCRAGVKCVAVAGGRPSRLALAKSLGAHATVDYHAAGSNLTAAVREAVGGRSANILETSGASQAFDTGFALAARGAKVLVLGDYGTSRASFPWNAILHRELELIGSNASAGAWPDAVRLATSGELQLAKLVSHHFPASCFVEAVDLVKGRTDGVVKVVMEW